MARLDIAQAPPASLPLRFLHTVPFWGAFAGLMLLLEGEALLVSRWSPVTVALVHVFTLGVLGNAMFGSLLQFLPVAAQSPVRGGPRVGFVLHGLLNLGALCRVLGLWWPALAMLRMPAALLLLAAFAGLAAACLPGLLARLRGSLLHAGLALSIACGLATAALGALLLTAMAGRIALALPPWTDVHAALGVFGWVLVLVASIGRVVMPMFQGTPVAPAPAQSAWLVAAVLLPPTAGLAGVLLQTPWPLRASAAALLALAALGGLWLQARARKPGTALFLAWRVGLLALLAAALLLPWPGQGLRAGALVLGIGLPLLVLGMLMEIAAFLAWVDLQRRCGRGVQLPGVQRLLPPPRRMQVLRLMLVAAALLLLALLWPAPWLLWLAGLATALAWLFLAWALRRLRRGTAAWAAALTESARRESPAHVPASAHTASGPAGDERHHPPDPAARRNRPPR